MGKEEEKEEVLTGTGILLISTTSSAGNSSSSASTRALKVPSSMKVVFKPNLTRVEQNAREPPETTDGWTREGKALKLSAR